MTLQEFVQEFNSQIPATKELTEAELYETFKLAVNYFRNFYYEAPEFDLDKYGRIILLETGNKN